MAAKIGKRWQKDSVRIQKSRRNTRRLASVSWRWRESNPRPNKEPPGFLHAYSAVGFRDTQGSERPKRDLISCVSLCRRSTDKAIPKLISTSCSGRNQESPPARCFVHPPCERIKPVIYCTSIKQREHNCCCQIIVESSD